MAFQVSFFKVPSNQNEMLERMVELLTINEKSRGFYPAVQSYSSAVCKARFGKEK